MLRRAKVLPLEEEEPSAERSGGITHHSSLALKQQQGRETKPLHHPVVWKAHSHPLSSSISAFPHCQPQNQPHTDRQRLQGALRNPHVFP